MTHDVCDHRATYTTHVTLCVPCLLFCSTLAYLRIQHCIGAQAAFEKGDHRVRAFGMIFIQIVVREGIDTRTRVRWLVCRFSCFWSLLCAIRIVAVTPYRTRIRTVQSVYPFRTPSQPMTWRQGSVRWPAPHLYGSSRRLQRTNLQLISPPLTDDISKLMLSHAAAGTEAMQA